MINQITVELNGGCFPTADQTLLLKAALLSGDEALAAWEKWSRIANLDRLDWGEVRLLPLLYHNLKQNGIPESQIPGVFKGMYRRVWAENKLRFFHGEHVLTQFATAGIPTIILKGAAIASHYYHDYGLRPMSDFDFLVPTERAEESIKILLENGWKMNLALGEDDSKAGKINIDYTYTNHARGFTNPQGQQVDLHWHVLHNSLFLDADRDFWTGARSIDLSGISTLILDPADQLLHVCVHGTSWNYVTPIRWVADAMIILSKYPDLDWQRLIEQTTKRRLMLPMQAALQFLVTHLAAPVTIEVLHALGEIEPTPEEEYCYQLQTSIQLKRTFVTKVKFVIMQGANYYRYRRGLPTNISVPLAVQIQEFPSFLQQYLTVDSKWQILGAGISKVMQHIQS